MSRPTHFDSLKVALADWVEGDVATYYLACSLGIMPVEDGSLDGFGDAKWIFCSGNPTGDALWTFMDKLVDLNFLEFDAARTRYRWNPAVQATWYDDDATLPNTSPERTHER